ncbi:MAG: hypothetical protein ABJH63_13190 [Rhizobiaceae bacterium]
MTLGEVRFGPTLSHDFLQDDGTVFRPRIGVNGVWNFSINNGASSQGAVLGNGDIRARVDVGLALVDAQSWAFNLSGFYVGIGVNDYRVDGGKARITIPLN